jgi:hypothetical protein
MPLYLTAYSGFRRHDLESTLAPAISTLVPTTIEPLPTPSISILPLHDETARLHSTVHQACSHFTGVRETEEKLALGVVEPFTTTGWRLSHRFMVLEMIAMYNTLTRDMSLETRAMCG